MVRTQYQSLMWKGFVLYNHFTSVRTVFDSNPNRSFLMQYQNKYNKQDISLTWEGFCFIHYLHFRRNCVRLYSELLHSTLN